MKTAVPRKKAVQNNGRPMTALDLSWCHANDADNYIKSRANIRLFDDQLWEQFGRC